MAKILAIDDNKDNLISLSAIIADVLPGSVFLTSDDGLKGIEIAFVEDPDVILLDILMPGMDGFEVCRRIKSNEFISDIPVIFLTSLKETKETLRRALELGADAFLTKPINEAEFVAQIQAMFKIKDANILKKREKETLAKQVEERTKDLQNSRNEALILLEKLKIENETRKRKEKEIKFQAVLLNSISESVIATDLNGKITYWNKGAEINFGWKEEEALGKDILDMTSSVTSHEQGAEIVKKLLQGETWKGEFLLKRKDGTHFPGSVHDFPILSENNELTGVLGVSFDISELKAAEEKLKYYNERLKLLTKVTEQVIGTHSIKIAANIMLKEILYAFKADTGIIRVFNEEGLIVLTKENVPDDTIVKVFPADFGILGQILKTKTPIAIKNTGTDEITKNITHFHRNAFLFHSYAGAPLLITDKVIGIIGIYNITREMEFSEEDLAHLQIAANHIAAAIENDNLYREILSKKTELENEISTRKKTEANLSQSEEQLSLMVKATNSVFYRLSYSNMRYEYIHPAIFNLTGYTLAEINETGFKALVLKIENAGGEKMDPEKLESERQKLKYEFHADYMIRKKDGEIRWLSDQSNPYYNENGELTGSIGMLLDITQRKEAEQEIKRAKEKAEELVSVKSSFFANMSHELRTPLVGIMGFSELLREELKGMEELQQSADFINISGKRLLETLNLILSVSKFEGGKIDLKLEEGNIIPILQEICTLYMPIAEKKGLNLEFWHVNDVILSYIDLVLIKSVFDNIVNNAIKFTDKGSVKITSEIEENEAVIRVSDTGIGISQDKQDIIWEEFRQVSEGLSRSFEGTGLGLTITKKYTELMGGKIQLTSTPGFGSTFTVRFPISSIRGSDFQYSKERRLTPDKETETSRIQPEKKSSILCVEDDEPTIQIVLYTTKGLYSMEIAKSAEIALNKVNGKVYDVILMDINLRKGMDGVELTKLIRKMPEYKNVPIIALTAYAADSDRERFLAGGMNDYLSKPFSRKQLLETIEKALKK